MIETDLSHGSSTGATLTSSVKKHLNVGMALAELIQFGEESRKKRQWETSAKHRETGYHAEAEDKEMKEAVTQGAATAVASTQVEQAA